MKGKPIQLPRRATCISGGLKIVSCYQFGKQDSADWLGGQAAGVRHAQRGWQLHVAAGGPVGAPIYASIDDDPTPDQYRQLVAPYLRGWESVLGRQRVGVYANAPTIEWARQDGIGSYYWQHNWGSKGVVHPAAHSAPGGDRQAQRRRRRRGHQPHTPAELRPVGLTRADARSTN